MANTYDREAEITQGEIEFDLIMIQHFVRDLRIDDVMDNMLLHSRIFERILDNFENIFIYAESACQTMQAFKLDHGEEMKKRIEQADKTAEAAVKEAVNKYNAEHGTRFKLEGATT